MTEEKIFRNKRERRLKVYSKYVDRANSWHPVAFPEIRLFGKWLLDAGFEHGQTIKVQQEENKIIITVANESLTNE